MSAGLGSGKEIAQLALTQAARLLFLKAWGLQSEIEGSLGDRPIPQKGTGYRKAAAADQICFAVRKRAITKERGSEHWPRNIFQLGQTSCSFTEPEGAGLWKIPGV